MAQLDRRRDLDLRALVARAAGRDLVTGGELADRLAAAGYPVSEDDVADHLQLDTRFALLDDELCFTPAVFEGVTFIAEVSELDAETGLLTAKPWLAPLVWWIVEGDVELRATDGSRIGVLRSTSEWRDGVDTDLVDGPDGWLDDMAGRHIALTVDGEALVLNRAPTVPTTPSTALVESIVRAAAVVGETFTSHPFGDDVEIEITVSDPPAVCHRSAFDEPGLWTAEAVMVGPALFAAAGLKNHRMGLVSVEFDDATLGVADRHRAIMYRYGVDDDTAFGVAFTVGLATMLDDDPDVADRSAALGLAAVVMSDPAAADAVADTAILQGSEAAMIGLTDAVVAELGEDAAQPQWSGVRAVAGICRLAVDDVDGAARNLDEVPPTFESHLLAGARMQLAWERSDAGGVRNWAATLRRLGARAPARSLSGYRAERLADSLVEQVGIFTSASPGIRVGRNDPCPCGSGKKYKRCHLSGGLLSAEERESWLYGKLVHYVLECCDEQRWAIAEEVAAASRGAVDEEDVVDTPMVIDIVLTSPGTISSYLSGRAETLEPEEILRANQWELVRPTVIEVEALGRDSLHVHDLINGDRRVITNVIHGKGIGQDSYAIATLLPCGESDRVIGGYVRLSPSGVETAVRELADGDPMRHAALLGSLLAPPRVANTDGDDIDVQRVVWEVPEVEAAATSLVAAGFTRDDESAEREGGPGDESDAAGERIGLVLVRDSANQKDTLIARAILTASEAGARLVVEVNSAERAAEAVDLVRGSVDGASYVGTERVEMDDAELDVPKGPDMADPAVRRAVEEHMLNYESEWLDTPIPALGGRTPRDAAGDPVGRKQLDRLLASFPEPPPGTVGMSARRLRVELGL